MTMRVKLENGFRFGFTGTPIHRTMTNTHRDFGRTREGAQERYPELLRHPTVNQRWRHAPGGLHP